MKIKYDGSAIDEPIDCIEVEKDFEVSVGSDGVNIEYYAEDGDEYFLTIHTEKQLDRLIKALQLAKSLNWLYEPKIVVDNDNADSEASCEQ